MQKIAIPVSQGKLAGHFGHAPMFFIYDIDNNKIVRESMEMPPPHEHGVIPKWLADDIRITAIIAGGMGQGAIQIFNAGGVDVYTGAPVISPKEIINEFIAGTLKTQANACNHDEHDRHGDSCHH